MNMSGVENRLGFTPRQLETILNFCKELEKKPRIPYNHFHRKYNPYSRKQSTTDLLNRAYRNSVVVGPYMYCNRGIEVTLTDEKIGYEEQLKHIENDGKTTYAMWMTGQWSYFSLSKGASVLEFYDSVLPLSINGKCIKNLEILEKGKLERDPYPRGWSEMHWRIYEIFSYPRTRRYYKVGEKLSVSWRTVRKYYEQVLEQCKSLVSFFPLGYNGYSYKFFTFETDYEIGILKALRQIDRTSHIYKFSRMIALTLFIPPKAQEENETCKKLKKLEEIGIIRNLHTATPVWHYVSQDTPSFYVKST